MVEFVHTVNSLGPLPKNHWEPLATPHHKGVGGDVLNTATALARLGHPVTFICALGGDSYGKTIAQWLEREKIKRYPTAIDVQGKTGAYHALVDPNGNRTFQYDRTGSATSQMTPKDIPESLFQGAKLLYTSGITLALSPTTEAAVFSCLERCKSWGIPTFFDINYRKALWENRQLTPEDIQRRFFRILPLCDWVSITWGNDSQVFHLINEAPLEGDSIENIFFPLRDKGAQGIIVKNGAEGCWVQGPEDTHPIHSHSLCFGNVVDTTGAGDAFNGGFIHGLQLKATVPECAQWGNRIAGLQITQYGGANAMPTLQEVFGG